MAEPTNAPAAPTLPDYRDRKEWPNRRWAQEGDRELAKLVRQVQREEVLRRDQPAK